MGLLLMARPADYEINEMSVFAQWFLRASERVGLNPTRVAEIAGIDRSYVNRLLNSYKPAYRYYKRPSYEKTLAIGQAVRDVKGAMEAADRLEEYQQRTASLINEVATEYADDPKWQFIVEAYNGSDNAGREHMESAAAAALRASRAGSIGGKRAE